MRATLRLFLIPGLFIPVLLTATPASSIHFEPNKGQWPSPVLFKTDIPSGHIFMERDALLFSFYSQEDLGQIHERSHDSKNRREVYESGQQKVRCYAYRLRFAGGTGNSPVEGTGLLESYSNYFLGNKPGNWAGNVSHYQQVKYQSVYPGIGLVLYGNEMNPEYDLVAEPGADVSRIAMQYEGTERMKIENGKLVLDLGFMQVSQTSPYAYQLIDGARKEVKCCFVLRGHTVTFEFPEGYDKQQQLIIDPVVVASTYSGSTFTTYGHSATFDDQGNIYSGGRCFGTGYPVSVGAYDLSFGGNVDMAISKYNPTGTSLIFATYVGGSSDEYAHSMFVRNGELYIYGSASSPDYPTTAGAFDASFNGGAYDIVVTHLNNTGSALIGSTYVGGTNTDGNNAIYTHYGDPYRGEIIVDAAGNAMVASFTSSSDFPASAGAYDASFNGAQDGCVIKLTPNMSTLTWSTFLGGTGNDAAFGIRYNATGDVFVCGATTSSDFPITVGTYQTSYQGGSLDGFVTCLNSTGTSLNASTFFGTADLDEAFFLDIDYDGDVYIYGEARGGAPVTAGTYSVAGSKMFVSKLNPALTNVLVSTVIGDGGSTTLAPSAFMVDVCKNIYLAGFGATSTFPVTSNAFYSSTSIGTCYLAALAPNATSLLFGTFYGANHVDGGTSRFDPSGIVYHAVCQGGTGFPTTPGAYNAGTSPPSWDVCVFKIDFEQMGVQAQATPAPAASGCAPFTVNFNNGSTGIDYIWDFGDGSPTDTSTAPSHTFLNTGTYNVMLIAIDSSSCNIADTAYVTITVLNQISAFLGNDTAFCPPGAMLLDAGVAGATYQWNTGATTQTINVTNPGNYWVTVSLGSNCTATDTIQVAQFTFNGLGPDLELCPGSSVMIAGATAGASYQWSTGATTSSIEVSQAGTYWVEMTWGNCSSSDTLVVDYSTGGDILPPNVFTPNGDGVNDFYDLGNPSADLFEIWIYDRWGIEMFYSNDPNFKWDGKYNGKVCPDGVYYWIVHYKNCAGEESEDHGFVHVVR